MNYYIDLIRTGDGTFTIGPYKSPPVMRGDSIFTDDDRRTLTIIDSLSCDWILYQRTETTPTDPDLRLGYDSFQIRAEADRDTRRLEFEVERLQFLAGKYFDEKIEAHEKLAAIDGLPKYASIESSWGVPDISGPWINHADIHAILARNK